jgi:ribose transport system permease protein
VPCILLVAGAVIAGSGFLLRHTVFGLRVYAVGGNPEAARLTGINVGGVLIVVYALSGFLAALGGVMTASRLYSANGQLGSGYELDAIAAVILGGTSFSGGVGGILGTLSGALIIAVLNNGLTLMNVSYYWQLVIKGVVIVLAVGLDRVHPIVSKWLEARHKPHSST